MMENYTRQAGCLPPATPEREYGRSGPGLPQALMKRFVLTVAFLFLCLVPAFAQVSLTATGGTTTGSFATVNAAFAAINAGTHTGTIVITVTANTTEPATPTPLLASGTSSSSYTSITIKPGSAGIVINGNASATASRGILELQGADNVTIDGSSNGTTSKDLTIQHQTSTTTGLACIRLSSNSATGTNGANNNTVKNCIIIGARSSATSTTSSYGIVFSDMSSSTTISTSTGAYSSINTVISNNNITRCYHGIYAQGTSATYPNTGLQITGNTIGTPVSGTFADATTIGNRGIFLSYTAATTGGALISGNDIRVGVSTTGYSATVAGIEIGTVNYGVTIDSNNIHDISQPTTSGYGAHGIYVTGAANNTLSTITNNYIRNCIVYTYQVSTTSAFIPTGVFFTAGATGVKFIHNTIVMPAQLGGSNFSSYCVNASVSGVAFTHFLNNILVNNHASSNAFGFYTSATGNISAGTVNNNDYYVPSGVVGYYNAANRSTLPAWQTATSKDANSVSVAPSFVSSTDAHLTTTGNFPLESAGASISTTGVSVDYDGQYRAGHASYTGSGTAPDLGADEFNAAVPPTLTFNSISPSATQCSTTPRNITVTVNPQGSLTAAPVLTYRINGGTANTINMTAGTGSLTTTGTWTATIPTVTPVNGTVTWSITATNSADSVTYTGASYTDAPLTGVTASATASPAQVCPGGTTNLSSVFAKNGGTVTVGSGTTSISSSTTVGAFYGSYYGNGRAQILYTATELTAAGLSAGNITALSVGVTGLGSPATLNGFTIKMANVSTTVTSITTFQSPTFTTVYSGNYTPVLGTNTHTFSTPFTWDGTSNIIVEYCFANSVTGSTSAVNTYTAVTGSFVNYQADGSAGASACTTTTVSNTSTNRPNLTFTGVAATTMSSYLWSTASDFSVNSGTTQNLTNVTVASVPSVYYVRGTDANGCTLTASVNIGAPASMSGHTITAGTPSFCAGGTTTLTQSVTGGCPTLTYAWTKLSGPASNDGAFSNATAQNPTFTATTGGTYVLQCVITDASSSTSTQSVTITVTNPQAATHSATPVCGTGTSTLTATAANSGDNLSWYTAATGGTLIGTGGTVTSPNITTATTYYVEEGSLGAGTATLGSGASSGTGVPYDLFNGTYGGMKSQYLFRASELNTAGIFAGNLTSLSLYLTATSATFGGFTIQIGTTTLTEIPAAANIQGGLTTVKNSYSFTPVIGTNTITFDSNFNWDGTSNIIVSFSWSNNNTSNTSSTITYDATSFRSGQSYRKDSETPANMLAFTGATGAGTFSFSQDLSRPRMSFGAQNTVNCRGTRIAVVVPYSTAAPFAVSNDQAACNGAGVQLDVLTGASDYTSVTWSPVTGLYTDAGFTTAYTAGTNLQTVYAKNTATGSVTYTASASNSTSGCSATDTVVVNTLPTTASITATATSYCGSGTPTLSVANAATTFANAAFRWQVSTNGTSYSNIAGANTASYTPASALTSTTYYRVYIADSNGDVCLQPTVTITVTDPRVASVADGTRCGVGTVTLGATPSSGATLNWYAAATGGTALATGNSYTTPSISATTTYYVDATQNTSGSVSSGKLAPESSWTGSTLSDWGVTFDVLNAGILNSVDVYSTTAGSMNVKIVNSAGTTLFTSATVSVAAGGTTTPTTIPLNYSIPAGTSYRIVVGTYTGVSLVRGSTNLAFPYNSGDISVTASWWSGTTTGTYYYFYNVKFTGSCTSARTAVTATVTPAPALTLAASSAQVCNGESATATLSSTASDFDTYTWAVTSGTGALPSGNAASGWTFSTTSTTSYTLTASNSSTGCANTTTYTVNVLPAAATITATPSFVCGSSATPTLSLTNAGNYTGVTYQWQVSTDGSSYSDIASATSTTYTVATAITTSTYYRLLIKKADGTSCLQPSTHVVLSNPSLTSSNGASRCGPGAVTLTGTGSAGSTLYWFGAATGGAPLATGNSYTTGTLPSTTNFYVTAGELSTNYPATIGAGASTTTGSNSSGATYSNPFTYYFGGYKSQYLIRASELAATGLIGGNLSSLGFNITQANSTYTGFTVNIAATSSTAISAFEAPTFTTVYSANVTPTVGTFNIPFTTPFAWDGNSNIIVQICWSNANSGGTAANSTEVKYDTTSFTSTAYYVADSQTQATMCAASTSTLLSTRPQMYINGSYLCSGGASRTMVTATINTAAALTTSASAATICNTGGSAVVTVTSNHADYDSYTWSVASGTGALPTGDINTGWTFSPSATTTYTLTANNTTSGCSNIASYTVTVLPATGTIATSGNNYCASGTPTLTLDTTAGYGSATYQWQVSTDGTSYSDVSGATGTTYTPATAITTTTYYKVVVKSSDGTSCIQPTITITVNDPTIVSIAPASRCGTGTVTLGATPNTGTTLTWYATATSTAPLGTGNTFTTPSISTTTTYYVEGQKGTAAAVVGTTSAADDTNDNYVGSHGIGITTSRANVHITAVSIPFTGTGTFTIQLRNSSGTAISNYTTASVTGIGTTPLSVPVDITVATAGDYYLIVNAITGNINDLGINSSVVAYPYTLSGSGISITKSYWYGDTSTDLMYIFNVTTTVPCTSARTAVTATVNTPPGLSLSSSSASICAGASSTTTLTSTASDYDSYVWSPSTGVSGNAASGWTFTPTTTTTYTLTATNTASSCVGVVTYAVAVNPLPSALNITASSTALCNGGVATLSVTGGQYTNSIYSQTFESAPAAFVTSGATATANSTYFAEGSGSILLQNSNFSTSGTYSLNSNLNLSGYGSAQITFSHIAALESPTTTYDIGYVEYSTNGGSTWTTFPASSYAGSGTLVSTGLVSFSTRSYSSWISQFTGSSSTPGTGPATSLWKYETINVPAAALTSQFRIRFRYSADSSTTYYGWLIDNLQITASAQSAVWSPTTGLYTNAAATIAYTGGTATTVYASPTATTTYTVTATTNTGCTATSSVTINSNVSSAPVAGDQQYCSGSTVANLTATGSNIQWYNVATGGTALVSTTTLTSGTYYASQTINGCESPRTQIAVNIYSTWNGTTSSDWATASNWCGNIVPTATDDVIIGTTPHNPIVGTGYTANAHNLTVGEGSSLTVSTGATLNVDNILSVNSLATLTVDDNGALLQGAATSTNNNSGRINFKKKGSSLYRLDYTLWASPVAGQNLGTFSPATTTNRFYTYNPATNAYATVDPANNVFTNAKGYLIRMPNADSAAGYNAGTTAIQYNGQFIGEPGNGNISVSLPTGFNAVGNPYPSPINISDFYNGNTGNIGGSSAIYLWRKRNSTNPLSTSYATITLAAFTANPSEGGGSENGEFYTYDETDGSDNWLLSPAQGFIVNVTGTGVNFTNGMRRATPGSTQSFFRQSQDRASRLWVNLTDATGGVSQTAIAYMNRATLGIDYGYDGTKLHQGGIISFYSLAENTALTIQARPAFADTDVVPMGYVAPAAGSFTIGLDHTDGVFSQGQVILLRDNLTGTITNLSEGSYTFATEAGTFETRFDILYNTEVLGTNNPVLDANTVIVSKQGTTIQINAGNLMMNGVTIYDTRGRKVYSMDNINNTKAAITNLTAEQQVLIVEINTVKGKVSKRIIF